MLSFRWLWKQSRDNVNDNLPVFEVYASDDVVNGGNQYLAHRSLDYKDIVAWGAKDGLHFAEVLSLTAPDGESDKLKVIVLVLGQGFQLVFGGKDIVVTEGFGGLAVLNSGEAKVQQTACLACPSDNKGLSCDLNRPVGCEARVGAERLYLDRAANSGCPSYASDGYLAGTGRPLHWRL